MVCNRFVVRCVPAAIVMMLTIGVAHGQTGNPVVDKLINEKNDLQRRLDECQAKNQGLETTLQQLRKTNADQAREKQDVETERDGYIAALVGLRGEHADVVKVKEALIVKTATLRKTVKDLEDSHAAVVKQSTDRQNQLNACNEQLEQAHLDLRNSRTTIATLEQTAERQWLLNWMRHRFPGTFGNEFNIESIVETLGGRSVAAEESDEPEGPTVPVPVTRSVAGATMGYLLLRMFEGGDVQVGGVPVSSNGQLYRLVSVPMTDSPRTVRVQANGYDTRVDIQFGQVVMFDSSRAVYQRQTP